MEITKGILKQEKESFLWTFCVPFVAGILGILLVIAVCSIGKNMTGYAPLGLMFALVVAAIIQIWGRIFSFIKEYNIAVSMSITRKSFVWTNQLITAVELVLLTLELWLIYQLEKLLYAGIFPDLHLEIDSSVIFQIKYVAPVLAAIWVAEFFMEAILLRFGMKAFWIIWAVWMIGTTGISKVLSLDKVQALFGKLTAGMQPVTGGVWVVTGLIVAVILGGISWTILKKQQVTA